DAISVTRQQETELPQKVDVLYLNKTADYQTGNQHSQRVSPAGNNSETLNLPLVTTGQHARYIADIALFNAWPERNSFEFILPPEYMAVEPADVVTVHSGGASHTVRVVSTTLGEGGALRVSGVAEDVSLYDFYSEPGEIAPQTGVLADPGQTELRILDLP